MYHITVIPLGPKEILDKSCFAALAPVGVTPLDIVRAIKVKVRVSVKVVERG